MEHSIGCQYQYALARLNLEDSAKMRILFWDAMNALEWDATTDAPIVPSIPDGCSQCRELG